MHFFYLDESGDTGRDLSSTEQPILVLGGVSVRDEGWRPTVERFRELITAFLGGPPPSDFELHASDLLSPEGDAYFAGRSRQDRNGLAVNVLQLLRERKHGLHFVAVSKDAVASRPRPAVDAGFDLRCPYLLGFDALVSAINGHVKKRLGQSARGLLVLDEKREFHMEIEEVMRRRRFEGPNAHRAIWITEAGYAVDSKKNPMVQMSDLIVYCVRRFLELDTGFHDDWPDDAKAFFARMYMSIHSSVVNKTYTRRSEPKLKALNDYSSAVMVRARPKIESRYGLDAPLLTSL